MISEPQLKGVVGAMLDIDPATIDAETSTDTVSQWDSVRHMNLDHRPGGIVRDHDPRRRGREPDLVSDHQGDRRGTCLGWLTGTPSRTPACRSARSLFSRDVPGLPRCRRACPRNPGRRMGARLRRVGRSAAARRRIAGGRRLWLLAFRARCASTPGTLREGRRLRIEVVADVADRSTQNDEYMISCYLPGLLLSHYLWPHHYRQMRFFEESFVGEMFRRDADQFYDVGVGTGMYSRRALTGVPGAIGIGIDISPSSKAFAERHTSAFGVGDRYSVELRDIVGGGMPAVRLAHLRRGDRASRGPRRVPASASSDAATRRDGFHRDGAERRQCGSHLSVPVGRRRPVPARRGGFHDRAGLLCVRGSSPRAHRSPWRKSPRSWSSENVDFLLERFSKAPDAVALIDGGRATSYGELLADNATVRRTARPRGGAGR